MLDLVFLALMIITLVKAIKGDYNELLCNISLVVGILAGILGIISAFFGDVSESFLMGLLNILVIVIAFVLRPVAQHFAQLYQNKLDEQRRLIEEEIEHARANSQRGFVKDASYINAEPYSNADSGAQSSAVPGNQNANGFGAQSSAVPGNQSASGFGAQGSAVSGNQSASGFGAQSNAVPGDQSANGFGTQSSAVPGNQSASGFGAQNVATGSHTPNGFGTEGNSVLPKK